MRGFPSPSASHMGGARMRPGAPLRIGAALEMVCDFSLFFSLLERKCGLSGGSNRVSVCLLAEKWAKDTRLEREGPRVFLYPADHKPPEGDNELHYPTMLYETRPIESKRCSEDSHGASARLKHTSPTPIPSAAISMCHLFRLSVQPFRLESKVQENKRPRPPSCGELAATISLFCHLTRME